MPVEFTSALKFNFSIQQICRLFQVSAFMTEKKRRKADGAQIGNGFRQIDGGCRICGQHVRQNKDQRDQQDKFPHDRYDNGSPGIAEGGKGHLTGNLDAEQAEGGNIDPQSACRKCQQCGVIRENGGKGTGKELRERPEQQGICKAHLQQQPERGTDTVHIAGAVIIADDRLRALAEALHRQHGKLHDAGQDGHGPDRHVPAVFQQRGVEADGKHAFAGLHDKGGKAECQTRQYDGTFQLQIFQAELHDGFPAVQKQKDPDTGKRLRNDRCNCRPGNPHRKAEDQNRVQNNVGNRTDDHGKHARLRKAL